MLNQCGAERAVVRRGQRIHTAQHAYACMHTRGYTPHAASLIFCLRLRETISTQFTIQQTHIWTSRQETKKKVIQSMIEEQSSKATYHIADSVFLLCIWLSNNMYIVLFSTSVRWIKQISFPLGAQGHYITCFKGLLHNLRVISGVLLSAARGSTQGFFKRT